MARLHAFRISACLITVLLAACGGGGGGGSSSVLPATAGQPAANGGTSAPAASVPVAFAIQIPTASTSSASRRPRYISAGTKSVVVTYAGSRQTADCTATCSLQLMVAPGAVSFAISLYDGTAGNGNALATGQTTTTIAAGQNNVVKVTFNGIVASVALALGSATVTAGTPASVPVTVSAKDAAGYTIVGPEPYANPIALGVDASTAATLSAAVLSAPSAPVTLAYNGSAGISALHVSANVPGTAVAPSSATLTVQSAPAAVASSAPAGVPARAATWYYYGLNGVNASIPASWMAAHTDYVESADDPKFGEAFKDAGGKYAAEYTDPAYVPYCFAPFTPGTKACAGQIGAYATDEGAWFHGADGTRVRRYVDDHFGYQEALNPGSASAQAAFHRTTTEILQNSPKLDFIYADESGGTYLGSDGTEMAGWFFGFNAAATEITTDAQFIPAEQAMLAAAARPIIINGVDPSTLLPSYNGTWIDSPNVAGQNFEGCYSDGNGVAGEAHNRWVNQSNALLMTYAHRRKGICMMFAPATPANRVYDLASWWMTYNDAYAVAAPISPTSDGLTVVPEYDIVPEQPRTSSTSDVAALRTAGGSYLREFAACYQAGASIGPCAAVVNPTSSAKPLPAFAARYTSALVLDDRSSFNGGTAQWTGAIPASLAPNSALVLR